MTGMLSRRRLVAGCLLPMAYGMSVQTAAMDRTEGDPLGSLQWPDLRQTFIGDDGWEFTTQVLVSGPQHAEDALNVPIMVDARALASAGRHVRRMRVVVDRNPIRHVLDYEPMRSWPMLAFRLRLEQASPVRALVQTDDGRWHVGGTWVQAAGGGCTVSGTSRTDGSWSSTLNQVRARFFRNVLHGSRRLRVHIMHPMDTGLVPGIPAFHLEHLTLLDAQDRPWWQLALHEPVAENPILSFEMPPSVSGPFRLRGQDNNGNRVDATVQA